MTTRFGALARLSGVTAVKKASRTQMTSTGCGRSECRYTFFGLLSQAPPSLPPAVTLRPVQKYVIPSSL